MARKGKVGTVRVQQYKSAIGYNRYQREVLRGMGFRRLNQIVELPDNDATRGMVKKIPHLVRVLPPESERGKEKEQ